MRDKLAYIIKQGVPESRQIIDPFEDLYGAGDVLEPPIPPEKLLLLTESSPVHSACLQAKAADSVGRGWKLVGGEEGEEEELRNQLEELTPSLPFQELLLFTAWELEAIGWSAWEVVKSGGRIAALYPIPAVSLRFKKSGGFIQRKGTVTKEFPAYGEGGGDDSEVFYFAGYSSRSSHYGIPRWLGAIPALAELSAIREYNLSWFESGGTADRIILCQSDALNEAEKIADLIAQTIESSRGLGHVSIVLPARKDSEVKVIYLSSREGQREGQFEGRRETLVREVLMSHGVPPYRISWAEVGSLGGSTAREMMEAYLYGVIEPLQLTLEEKIRRLLKDLRPDLKGTWELNDLTPEERELDLKFATDAIEHGFMTPNEAREFLGLGRVPEEDDLDRFFFSANLKPAGEGRETVKALEELQRALEETLDAEQDTATGGLVG